MTNGTFFPPNHATFLHNIFRKMIREGLILIFEAKMINISSHYTVWKFKDFSATHSLREIRLSNCGISKLPFWPFQSNTFKCQFLKISKIEASKMLKFAVFESLKLPNLISRKIWVAVPQCGNYGYLLLTKKYFVKSTSLVTFT